MFFVIEEAKETVLNFSQGTIKVFAINAIPLSATSLNNLIFISIKSRNTTVKCIKLSNSQLNKLKAARKKKTEVVLIVSLNMIGDDETNFLHKLLLSNRQVSNLRKVFADKSSTDISLSKTQISGGFLGRLLVPLLKTGFLPIKNVIKPLAKLFLHLLQQHQQQMQEYIKKNLRIR